MGLAESAETEVMLMRDAADSRTLDMFTDEEDLASPGGGIFNTAFATDLVDTLPTGQAGLFNPWRDHCADDEPWNGPEAKLVRLAAHLDCRPKFILCGEAPGLGCRHSGIAFTSERLLLEGLIPRVPRADRRLTSRALPFSEPSATIVWSTLHRLGLAESTILWNALQLHPHRPEDWRSNRTPTPAELALGEPALRKLIDAFPEAKMVAVGRKAEALLHSMGVVPHAAVRHPANGGATEFAVGLGRLVVDLAWFLRPRSCY